MELDMCALLLCSVWAWGVALARSFSVCFGILGPLTWTFDIDQHHIITQSTITREHMHRVIFYHLKRNGVFEIVCYIKRTLTCRSHFKF